MPPLTIVSPTACIGLGPTDRNAFERAVALEPDFIGADMGSTDPGPYYLGAGAPHVPRIAAKRDLEMILFESQKLGIPCIIGTAGGNGARPHVEWTIRLIHEIAEELRMKFDMEVIYADVPLHVLLKGYDRGEIESLDGSPPASSEAIEESTYAVVQMGIEPLVHALKGGADVILAGRCCDDAIFAALPVFKGYDKGLSLHMGKILECAGVSAVPSFGFTAMVARMENDSFTVSPTDPDRRATVASVSAHSLYERRSPLEEPGPGGITDMRNTTFEQVDDRTVRVKGSRWVEKPYRLKVEAARPIGYRSIAIAGVRGPTSVSNLDSLVTRAEKVLATEFRRIPRESYRLTYHRFGIDAVMKQMEPWPKPAHEVGLVIDVVADDQDTAHAVADLALMSIFSFGSRELKAASGNIAPMYSPWTLNMGRAYEFSLYHTIPVDDPLAPHRFETVRVG